MTKGIAIVWLPKQIERFKTLWFSGVALRVIAAEFGCGETSVRKVVKDLKLKPRPKLKPSGFKQPGRVESEYWVTDRKERVCLGCHKQFLSRGRWTFMCNDCKSRKAWHSGGDFGVRA